VSGLMTVKLIAILYKMDDFIDLFGAIIGAIISTVIIGSVVCFILVVSEYIKTIWNKNLHRAGY
jgi:hypothetical protein